MTYLQGPELPAKQNKPKYLVVILHGLGADGDNVFSLSQAFSEVLPEAHYVAPNGIETCDIASSGYQWFSLSELNLDNIQSEISRASNSLYQWVETKLASLGLDFSSLILVGFSQGAMVALNLALYNDLPVKAIISFSGALCGAEKEKTNFINKPPILCLHGREDEVLYCNRTSEAASLLAKKGLPVEHHILPGLGHFIDMREINLANKFLQNKIK